ncbi:BlaI/MecI/CopY family transcriptional regulator [Streptomyces sp. Qhu-G9]|uniref:BlaI/MecI/CopY family transcriptional regulator n=1 Tax=Streptomyces sp. Qhu-G9 TaxID=3452799 RepID=UPI0022ABDF59|nr:BlaI/MecI/CopY family transcriptional regulator [Streptomyces aurantiacus]WAU83408.1 BlaI/MecI/CopY family transcriptional regulator [Streptomyces aurantiacus]
MSEVESAATELKTQYAAQVAADLERNTKEQERIGAEVAALEEQLSALQHDRTLLAELRRALGGENDLPQAARSAGKGSTPKPSVPRQATATAGRRKKATATKAAAKPAAAKPATKPAVKAAAPKPTPKAATKADAAEPAVKPAAAKPTLVELIRDHLAQQSEPRSSAEVTTALTQAHPDREIKPKVVRTTVEGLVAKGQVQRTKQGSSVFYTPSGTAPADTSAEQVAETA